MDANEAMVRNVWERVSILPSGLLEGYVWITRGSNGSAHMDWSAAAAYTETVKREAAELREEIAIQEDYRAGCISTTDEHAAITRTIARLQGIYAAHIRGIKPEALTTRAA